MKMEISVAEAVELINEIRQQPDGLFEMIRSDVKKSVGQYMSELMETELTGFLGRDRYERVEVESNHRNGSYGRKFTLKGIGEVGVKVPRDRKGEFSTQVIPRGKQYEDALREDLCAMFLAGGEHAHPVADVGKADRPKDISDGSEQCEQGPEPGGGGMARAGPIHRVDQVHVRGRYAVLHENRRLRGQGSCSGGHRSDP